MGKDKGADVSRRLLLKGIVVFSAAAIGTAANVATDNLFMKFVKRVWSEPRILKRLKNPADAIKQMEQFGETNTATEGRTFEIERVNISLKAEPWVENYINEPEVFELTNDGKNYYLLSASLGEVVPADINDKNNMREYMTIPSAQVRDSDALPLMWSRFKTKGGKKISTEDGISNDRNLRGGAMVLKDGVLSVLDRDEAKLVDGLGNGVTGIETLAYTINSKTTIEDYGFLSKAGLLFHQDFGSFLVTFWKDGKAETRLISTFQPVVEDNGKKKVLGEAWGFDNHGLSPIEASNFCEYYRVQEGFDRFTLAVGDPSFRNFVQISDTKRTITGKEGILIAEEIENNYPVQMVVLPKNRE